MGPTLAIEADDVRIAVAGAKAAIDILPDVAAAGGRSVAGMQSIRLRRGEVLRIGALTGATVLYVAVEGGFDIEPVLGSVSTDLRGGIGGWQGRALVAGDRLPLRLAQPSEREEVGLEGLFLRPRPRIRVITGPQHDHFSDNEVAAFLDSEYTVGPSADRMGMRLTGRTIRHSRGSDIVSDGIAPGSIQVPRHSIRKQTAVFAAVERDEDGPRKCELHRALFDHVHLEIGRGALLGRPFAAEPFGCANPEFLQHLARDLLVVEMDRARSLGCEH